MTTERQTTANRRNAKASTGPLTAAGKRKVARNARRHGLTAPAPWDVVTNWYRIIVNDPHAEPDPTAQDVTARTALRLAEAEAQVARTTQAERAILLEIHDDTAAAFATPDMKKRVIDRVMHQGVDYADYETLKFIAERIKRTDPVLAKGTRILAAESRNNPVNLQRRLRTISRYRREAESRRRRALRDWLATQK